MFAIIWKLIVAVKNLYITIVIVRFVYRCVKFAIKTVVRIIRKAWNS